MKDKQITMTGKDTFELLKELDEFRAKIKEELLSSQVKKLEPFDCEVHISRWQNAGSFDVSTRITIKTKDSVHTREFEDPIGNTDITPVVKELITEIIDKIVMKEVKKINRALLGDYKKGFDDDRWYE